MNNYKATFFNLFEAGKFPEDAFYIHKVFRDRKITIYGAGESFHYFKEIVMRQYGYTPSIVLDLKFQNGDTFEGIPAFSPLQYKPSSDEKQNGIVVVCLGRQNYFDNVVQMLREMGYRHIISLMDIYEIHNPFRIPQELEDKGFQYYISQREKIESCLDILADEGSKEVYIHCLQTHLRRKPIAIPMCDREEQYTPKGIKLGRGYSRIIYCGVSVGEMKRIFRDIGKVDEIACLEPDPNQFRLTAEYLSKYYSEIANRIMAVPCAVYSHEAIEPFTYSDTSFGSRILASGKFWIQAVSIDHILPGSHPTFINMDVEGAELEALKGAENTIRTSQPDLAICIYHAPNHLWDIPLYLNSLGLGYQFYMRNYTTFINETVLYATI